MDSEQTFQDSYNKFHPRDHKAGLLDLEGREVKKDSFPEEKNH